MPPEIVACLASGEKILWSGRPRPYVFILRGLPNIAYGVTWSVLGAFWYHGASIAFYMGWWRVVPLLSFPFIAAGFSFWLYPIRLGARARRTWYVVTNQRVFTAELDKTGTLQLRVFAPEEMGAPHVVKRLDGLYEVVLTRSAQGKPYLIPRLESGFFGIKDGDAAVGAINAAMNP